MSDALEARIEDLEDEVTDLEDEVRDLESQIADFERKLELGGPAQALAAAVRARLSRHTFPETDEPELYSALDAFDVAVAGR